MEYTKPIYENVENCGPQKESRGIGVVLILAGIIGAGVSGCSKS